jgi:hypothetical protein
LPSRCVDRVPPSRRNLGFSGAQFAPLALTLTLTVAVEKETG